MYLFRRLQGDLPTKATLLCVVLNQVLSLGSDDGGTEEPPLLQPGHKSFPEEGLPQSLPEINCFSSSTSTKVTTSTSFELPSSHARVTSINLTKQESASQSVSQ